ncbi:MAG: hypothetical protein R3E62_09505 [Pseudomonadales bacterium]|jgi:hypothetical protein
MDLTEQLLGDCSPYIANLVYDIDVRMLFIECVDSPESQRPALRLVFPEIIAYSENNQLDHPDDENMDDILEIFWKGDNELCIETFKKEITLQLTGKPFTEVID